LVLFGFVASWDVGCWFEGGKEKPLEKDFYNSSLHFTQLEQVFCLIMMIISSLLYAAIFGHVTTIIHNMTQATAKYHEMLDAVR
jgi:hypothetical protein